VTLPTCDDTETTATAADPAIVETLATWEDVVRLAPAAPPGIATVVLEFVLPVTAISTAPLTVALPSCVTLPVVIADTSVVAELLGMVAVMMTLPALTVRVISAAEHPEVLAIDCLTELSTVGV
jgi:hypothetical protein